MGAGQERTGVCLHEGSVTVPQIVGTDGRPHSVIFFTQLLCIAKCKLA